jgi:hypothetical protein
MPPSESRYLDKLIVDYIGKPNPDDEDEYLLGAIQKAQHNNKYKSEQITQAAWLLGQIVVGLVVLAMAAVEADQVVVIVGIGIAVLFPLIMGKLEKFGQWLKNRIKKDRNAEQ